MANYFTTDTELTSIADAIRVKGGTSSPLSYPAGFISAINAIQGGSISSVIFTSDESSEGQTKKLDFDTTKKIALFAWIKDSSNGIWYGGTKGDTYSSSNTSIQYMLENYNENNVVQNIVNIYLTFDDVNKEVTLSNYTSSITISDYIFFIIVY